MSYLVPDFNQYLYIQSINTWRDSLDKQCTLCDWSLYHNEFNQSKYLITSGQEIPSTELCAFWIGNYKWCSSNNIVSNNIWFEDRKLTYFLDWLENILWFYLYVCTVCCFWLRHWIWAYIFIYEAKVREIFKSFSKIDKSDST